jgi:hypothetical protein
MHQFRCPLDVRLPELTLIDGCTPECGPLKQQAEIADLEPLERPADRRRIGA